MFAAPSASNPPSTRTFAVGAVVGVGVAVGAVVGVGDAVAVGVAVAGCAGLAVGFTVGEAVAAAVGEADAAAVGEADAPALGDDEAVAVGVAPTPEGGGVVAAVDGDAEATGLAFGAGVNTELPPLQAVIVSENRTSSAAAREFPDMGSPS